MNLRLAASRAAAVLLPAAICLAAGGGCSWVPWSQDRKIKKAKAATSVNTTGPALEPRLANSWLAAATRIKEPGFVVYYKGAANRHSLEGRPWTGDIFGEILHLTPRAATVISDGSMSLRFGGSITASGNTRTVLAAPGAAPPWQHLLEIK